MEAEAPSHSTTYDAFISYSRRDKAFASLLQKALEGYRPAKDLAVPQRYLKVFRDEQDFTGSEYYESLDRHLQNSGKLIVVCSPHARYSPHPVNYVDDEIRRYSKSNTAANIIPILLSGIPNNEAKPGEEGQMGFPEALCEVMRTGIPLASDYRGFEPGKDKIRKGSFESAWFKVLADLYGKSRAEIEQRERKRQIRRRNAALAIGMISLIVLVSLISWAIRESWMKEDERLAALGMEASGLAQARGMEIKALVKGVLASDRRIGIGPPPPTSIQGIVDAVYAARRSLPIKVDDIGVTTAKLSSDGKLLLTTGLHGSISIWDPQNGALVKSLVKTEDGQPAWSAAFSPDGRTVVTGTGKGTVELWDVTSGKKVRNLASLNDVTIWSVQFSPDGQFIAAGCQDGHLRLWSADNGDLIADRAAHISNLRIVQFSPDGAFIATARWNPEPLADGKIRLWDGRTGKPIRDLVGHTMDVRDLIWVQKSTGMVLVTGSVDRTVRQWDVQTGRQTAKPYKGNAAVYAVAFSHAYGLIASGDEDGSVTLWTSYVPSFMSGHTGAVYEMATARNGDVLATAGKDGTIRLWSPLPGYSGEIQKLEGHSGPVNRISWSRDEKRLVSAGDDGDARVWSLEATKPQNLKEAINWACKVVSHRDMDKEVDRVCDRMKTE
jgi:WD40 repeat protein